MNRVTGMLRLSECDNVAIAITAHAAGGKPGDEMPVLVDDIPAGHKFALEPIARGATVYKFGQPIGVATSDIAAGAHVHVQNLSAEIETGPYISQASDAAAPASGERAFDAYVRGDGTVGTRNYVGIVSTVNCSATVIRHIAAAFPAARLEDYHNVDGVCPITHTTGCGMSGDGDGIEILRRTLGGYIRHPNMGGVLVVGLGCEVNDIPSLLRSINLVEGDTLRTMSIQEAGGTRAAVERGTAIVEQLLEIANRAERRPVPVAGIRLGLQCGGSDSFSGVSANPALGYAADRLVAAGGTVILGETPEIHGAEHLLLGRAASPEVADALRERLAWWESYVARHGASLDNNPSPGNIAGGISTIFEKSLGAVMKSGTSPLRGVYQYAQPIEERGFVFMDSPGYDPCSITGEIAAGANVVCFTTGRGSVFGAKPVPSIKLATNSAMAGRMADDMDYDCGAILCGDTTLEAAGADIFELIVATASGSKSASERNGLGDFEFVPWQIGAVL